MTDFKGSYGRHAKDPIRQPGDFGPDEIRDTFFGGCFVPIVVLILVGIVILFVAAAFIGDPSPTPAD